MGVIGGGPSPVAATDVSHYAGRVQVRPVTEGGRTFAERSSAWERNDTATAEFCHGIDGALLGDMKKSLEKQLRLGGQLQRSRAPPLSPGARAGIPARNAAAGSASQWVSVDRVDERPQRVDPDARDPESYGAQDHIAATEVRREHYYFHIAFGSGAPISHMSASVSLNGEAVSDRDRWAG